MEFLHSFVPVSMKYDFTSEYGSNVAKEWIECRVNVKPNVTNRCIRITIYPKCYIDTIPNFVLDINGTNIDCGPVKSRSKNNVYGVVWSDEQNEKCRIFIAFDNKGMHQNFSKYFKELLKLYGADSDGGGVAANTENVKSPMCNEAVKMTSNSGQPQTNASSIQIMRVSNASAGSCEDVVLRSEPVAAVQSYRRRLARSLAAISGWFKSIRDRGGINLKKIDEHSTKNGPQIKRTKRKTWNIFKLNEKKIPYDDDDVATPSYQHFQEPLNIERPSLAGGGNIDINGYSDAEWYDLNKDEMSLFEARVLNILSDFNSYNQTSISSSTSDGGMVESSNTLRSHNNLSMPCKLNDENKRSKLETTPTSSISSMNGKQNHFTRTKSIRFKKSVEQMVLIDDIMTKPIDLDFDGNCISDESCKLSSGFGSDESETNSPREFARKFKAFTNSPTNIEFFEKALSYNQMQSNDLNECLPITATSVTNANSTATSGDATTQLPIQKNMQKMSKKHRIQINSRKLFGIHSEEHTPSPHPVNVTPQYKSPLPPPMECRTKKVRNGTPFKICCSMESKQMYVTEV